MLILGIDGSMVGIMVFIAAVFLLKGLVIFSSQAYQAHLQAQLLREIKSKMFDRYSTMDYGYYCHHNTGHFVNVVNSQVGGLISSFMNYKDFISISITTLIYLLTAFLLAWDFALMALGSGVLLLFLFRGLNAYVHGLSRRSASEHSTLNKFLVQTLQAFKYLSSTGELEHLRKGVVQSIQKLTGYMRSKGIAQAFTEALSEPIAICFVLVVIVIQVRILNASLLPIFVALLLFNRAMSGIMRIQKAWQNVMSKVGSLEMVENEFELLAQNQEITGPVQLPPFQKTFECKDIHFAYPKSVDEVLCGISLSIQANTTVAFVGESGAGKSTLIDMLTLLLRPQSGEIVIDGVVGGEVDLASWRRQIGYVSQETVVFDDTVANNIAMWKENYDESEEARERIDRAASAAYADRFIHDLPEGYHTVVGDRGVRLSGGQRQRLFLARELYKQPRLLILDEATSALDSESERYIQESIDALKGQMTVILIAHRLSTIRNADVIYVLDKGCIVEEGSYSELIAKPDGRFRRMVELQSLDS